MEIISPYELASYLREPSLDADLIVELANAIVSEVLPSTVTAPSARVRAITFEAAARAYRNPQGLSSETIDDYTYRRDAETRQAGVYLTPAERAELQGPTAAVYTLSLA